MALQRLNAFPYVENLGPSGGLEDLRDALKVVRGDLADVEKLAARRLREMNLVHHRLTVLVGAILQRTVPSASTLSYYEEAMQHVFEMRETYNSVFYPEPRYEPGSQDANM